MSPLLKDMFEISGEKDFAAHKNALYLRLAKWVVRYSWLIVFLTAASPLFDESFFVDEKEKHLGRYASARCSEIGYNNPFIPILNYDDLSGYIKSIEDYVERGEIIVPSELYYPVRLKSSGANSLVTLGETGVNHIELRMLDLNPLSEAGIFEEDITFIHLLLIYLASKDDFVFTDDMQIESIKTMYRAALLYNSEIKDSAHNALIEMKKYFGNTLPDNYSAALDYQIDKVTNPDKRYANIIRKLYGDNFTEKGLELSKQTANI